MTPRVRHLRVLLEELRPSGARQRGARQRMLQLLGLGEQALSRDTLSPGHFTASALVLDPAGRELLLIHHRRLQRWLQPGGHVEPGDADVVASARRELAEEVGIRGAEQLAPGIFDVDIHLIEAGPQPAHYHFDLRFAFRTEQRKIAAASDAEAARWVPLDQLRSLASDASVLRAAALLAPRATR